MAPKKARQIDGKHVHSSLRVQSKDLPRSRATEMLKSCHLAKCLERRKEYEKVPRSCLQRTYFIELSLL